MITFNKNRTKNLTILIYLLSITITITNAGKTKNSSQFVFSVKGLVYNDINHSSLYDKNENGMPSVIVKEVSGNASSNGAQLMPTQSDSTGHFVFNNLKEKTQYTFEFTNPADYIFEDFIKLLACPTHMVCLRPSNSDDHVGNEWIMENTYALNVPLIYNPGSPANTSITRVHVYLDVGEDEEPGDLQHISLYKPTPSPTTPSPTGYPVDVNCEQINCPVGFFCSTIDGEAVCHKFCETYECPQGSTCSISPDGSKPICIPSNSPCDGYTCPPAEMCTLLNGAPKCVPNLQEEDINCDQIRCPDSFFCSIIDGQAVCHKFCETYECPQGTTCTVSADGKKPVCTSTNADCNNFYCPMGEVCSSDGGPHCIPNPNTKPSTCDDLHCAAGQICSIINNAPICTSPSGCQNMSCDPGFVCQMNGMIPSCVPANSPTPNPTSCVNVICPPGYTCRVVDSNAVCSAANPNTCEGFSCPPGSSCNINDIGQPYCLLQPNTCATYNNCPSGTHCEMVNNSPTCVANSPPIVNETCDSYTCPYGYHCIILNGSPYCAGDTTPTPSEVIPTGEPVTPVTTPTPSLPFETVPPETPAPIIYTPVQFPKVTPSPSPSPTPFPPTTPPETPFPVVEPTPSPPPPTPFTPPFEPKANCTTRVPPCPTDTRCEMINDEPVCTAIDSCSNFYCPPSTQCQMVTNRPECIPLATPPPPTCENTNCPSGTECSMQNGIPSCLPTCSNMICNPESKCVIESGSAKCVPICATVTCASGTICTVTNGAASCVPSCGTMSCPSGTICSVISGVASCLSVCANVTCPEGSSCTVQNDTAVCTSACATIICPKDSNCVVESGVAKCVSICSTVQCPNGTFCTVLNGVTTCVPVCDQVNCPPGSSCTVQNGNPVCIPSCDRVKCPPDTTCLMQNQIPVCASLCANVTCPLGSECRIISSVPTCVPTCSNITCPPDSTCQMINNIATCMVIPSCARISCPNGYCQIINGVPTCLNSTKPIKDGVALMGKFYIDSNGDGTQQDFEANMVGLELKLTTDPDGHVPVKDSNGNPIEPVTTDDEGKYKIENIPYGVYYLQYKLPPGMIFSGPVGPISLGDTSVERAISLYNVTSPYVRRMPPTGLFPKGDSQVSGIVFHDKNFDNIYNKDTDILVSGIKVEAYLPTYNYLLGTSTSDSTGTWSITELPPNFPIRLQYILNPQISSAGSPPAIFVKGGDTDLKFGILFKNEANSNEGPLNPTSYLVSLFIRGGHSSNFSSEASVFQFYKNATGHSYDQTGFQFNRAIAFHRETGAVNGMAYDPIKNQVFFSAYHTLFADYGPGGTGGIYLYKPDTFKTSLLVNLNDVKGADYCGKYSHKFTSYENDEFQAGYGGVTHVGFGQMEFTKGYLYATNLAQNTIEIIPTIPSAPKSMYKTMEVPNPGCLIAEEWKIFPISIYQGSLFVGGTCTSEQGSPPKIYVLRHNFGLQIWETVLESVITYPRLIPFGSWTNQSAPQAYLASISFDDGGTLSMAIRDRSDDMRTNMVTPSPDLLIACLNKNGQYDLEFKGVCGNKQGYGLFNPDFPYGPGGSYFFKNNKNSKMIAASNTIPAGLGYILATSTDYDQTYQGVVRWYNLGTGVDDKAFALSNHARNPQIIGLGGLLGLYNPTFEQYQMGRIWHDLNGNGIQDCNEPGIFNIPVHLYYERDLEWPIVKVYTDCNGYFKVRIPTPNTRYAFKTPIYHFAPFSNFTLSPISNDPRFEYVRSVGVRDETFIYSKFMAETRGGTYLNHGHIGIVSNTVPYLVKCTQEAPPTTETPKRKIV
eukprot:gene6646-8223_t